MKRGYIIPVMLIGTALSFVAMAAEFTNCRSGLATLSPESSRREFRLSRAAFDAASFSFEYSLRAASPVHGAVFVKDKDGNFFQHEKHLPLENDGKWHRISVRIDEKNGAWRAFSSSENWNSRLACGIYSAGLSFWSDKAQNVKIELRNPRYEGKRAMPPPAIGNPSLPERGVKGKLLCGKFELSREYFNPFDPGEIAVDYEVVAPDGKRGRYPAFFTSDFSARYDGEGEKYLCRGTPYWEFRHLPLSAGEYKFRLAGRENGGEEFFSAWRKVTVEESDFPGIIQVSRGNAAFFEFSGGKFFLPIGLNIHSNTDYRSEIRLRLGPLADRGVADFADYFRLCAANGINCVEIWMASWTFALEWSSKRHDYYGIGRYNMANAAKLDKIFELAGQYGIYINLVWDNHGKFAASANQEWFENPCNKESEYAVADGGFMTGAANIFTDAIARKYWLRRNRYIAARYGQQPQIFAMQLWSEVDLVMNFAAAYADESCAKQHGEIIRDYQRYTPLRQLITTHVCGDADRNLRNIGLWNIPEVTHLVGDAYRSEKIPMFEQMRKQYDKLSSNFAKPCLITEFGGSSSGNGDSRLEADIHAGLWSAIFKKQAGLPFLWWHDFVILGGRLGHYRGVAEFVRRIDLRRDWQRRECRVFNTSLTWRAQNRWERRFESMVLWEERLMFGWVYNAERMYEWSADSEPWSWDGIFMELPPDFAGGRCEVTFFDTMSGAVLDKRRLEVRDVLPLIPLGSDIAFRLEVLP